MCARSRERDLNKQPKNIHPARKQNNNNKKFNKIEKNRTFYHTQCRIDRTFHFNQGTRKRESYTMRIFFFFFSGQVLIFLNEYGCLKRSEFSQNFKNSFYIFFLPRFLLGLFDNRLGLHSWIQTQREKERRGTCSPGGFGPFSFLFPGYISSWLVHSLSDGFSLSLSLTSQKVSTC